MADRATRKLRIFQDEVKLRHTSHWDMDMMSRSDLDAYMSSEHRRAHADTQQVPPTQPVAGPETAWSRFLRAILPAR